MEAAVALAARILDRTPAAARQLANRTRRQVRGAEAPSVGITIHRELVNAFLEASRDGDFERLLAVLSPEVVLRADDQAVRIAAARRRQGAPELASEVHGALRVANAFKGRARGAVPALVDDEAGAVWAVNGVVRAAFVFTIDQDKIAGLDIVMDPARLAELDLNLD